MKVGFISLGCPKNLVDTEIMMARLKTGGHRIVNDRNKAEVIIVNTCGFLESAREEAIDTLLECAELKKTASLKFLIAVGCLTQICAEELVEELPEVDAIAGISAVEDIEIILANVIAGQKVCKITEPDTVAQLYRPRMLSSSPGTAYLRIADGCNNHCTYCLIPSIRGTFRSKPRSEIMKEARILAETGIKEIVLIAQDLCEYGSDLREENSLADVLRDLTTVEGISWIRLMYLHPGHLSDKIIELISEQEKIVPYLEIPVQHASDRILRAMNRHYTQAALLELFDGLRQRLPGITLRTTVMVGFPGESDQDFAVLEEFVKKVEFDWLGAFIYEPQEGTAAADLTADIVPAEVAEARRNAIMELQQGITRSRNQMRVGKRDTVLIEKRISSSLYIGRGSWQAPEVDGVTMIRTNARLEPGTMITVLLKGIRNYDMIGEYCQ